MTLCTGPITTRTPAGYRAKTETRRRLAINIHKARVAKGWRREDLSKAMDAEATCAHHWETGFCAPTSDRIPMLAQVLGVTLDQLYDGVWAGKP